MNNLHEIEFEKRDYIENHADGTATYYTMKIYADGMQITYAQEIDETGRIVSDIYDVEWDDARWQQSDILKRMMIEDSKRPHKPKYASETDTFDFADE